MLHNCDMRPFEAHVPRICRWRPRRRQDRAIIRQGWRDLPRVRRAIIEQALEPGAKLPEDSLGERFGVSRTIARQALGRLAAEGLVELRRNRISVVATPSWQEARDAFDVRKELERLVAQQLAGRLTKAQLTSCARMSAKRRRRTDSRCRLDPPSHGVSHPAGRNDEQADPVRYVSELAYRCCLTISLHGRPHSSECAVKEHRAIIDALARSRQGREPYASPSRGRGGAGARCARQGAQPGPAGNSGALRRGGDGETRGEDA